jgi:hypothetical protein
MKTRIAAVSLVAALVLAACSRQERVREIDWAKAALARNPAFEIVATDETAGVFTVKDTATGTITTLKVGDLVAAPAPSRVAAVPAAQAPAAPAVEPALAADPTTDAAADEVAQPAEEVVATPAPAGAPLVEGPGYSISRADSRTAAAPAASTIEGPGYSIVREVPTARPSAPRAEVTAANVVRRSDPIICQGERLLRIDGETLEFSGDALIAEEGCDLYISNARIHAGGVGVIARQARVHIVNSTITGSGGSYEASQGAEVYASSTTFTGIGRRFDSAKVTDLGGNRFRTQ